LKNILIFRTVNVLLKLKVKKLKKFFWQKKLTKNKKWTKIVTATLIPGRRHAGRHPPDGSQPPAPRGGHHVRAAVERPAAHARPGALEARRRLPGADLMKPKVADKFYEAVDCV
jgi:hypothetical protein